MDPLSIGFAVVGLVGTVWGLFYARASLLEARRPPSLPRAVDIPPLDVMSRVRTDKVLRVGCLWYPPFVDYTIDGDVVNGYGLYPTILATLANSEQIKIKYSVLKWHEAISSIENGLVDVVACVLKSGERRKHGDFAGTIFRVGVGAVVKRGQSKIGDHGDLARPDVSIAVTKGEIGWTHATEDLGINPSSSRLTVLEDKRIQTMMALVDSGDVDCALADSLSCAQFIQNSGMTETLEDIFCANPVHVEDNCLMLAKGNLAFRDWLSAGIRSVRTTPEIRQLEFAIENRYRGILRRAGGPA